MGYIYERELQSLRTHDEVQHTQISVYGSAYSFIETAMHGYLVVPKGDSHYKVAQGICSYGYKGKLAVYLEEDCEILEFFNAIGFKVAA